MKAVFILYYFVFCVSGSAPYRALSDISRPLVKLFLGSFSW